MDVAERAVSFSGRPGLSVDAAKVKAVATARAVNQGTTAHANASSGKEDAKVQAKRGDLHHMHDNLVDEVQDRLLRATLTKSTTMTHLVMVTKDATTGTQTVGNQRKTKRRLKVQASLKVVVSPKAKAKRGSFRKVVSTLARVANPTEVKVQV